MAKKVLNKEVALAIEEAEHIVGEDYEKIWLINLFTDSIYHPRKQVETCGNGLIFLTELILRYPDFTRAIIDDINEAKGGNYEV